MGGFFGVAAKDDCMFDLFFGTDYHSHLGTRRGGMAVYGEKGFDRAIHNIENAPFRTKFDKDMQEMKGNLGIGCISDYEPQPLIVRSHHGTYAITTVSKINNANEIVEKLFSNAYELITGTVINPPHTKPKAIIFFNPLFIMYLPLNNYYLIYKLYLNSSTKFNLKPLISEKIFQPTFYFV